MDHDQGLAMQVVFQCDVCTDDCCQLLAGGATAASSSSLQWRSYADTVLCSCLLSPDGAQPASESAGFGAIGGLEDVKRSLREMVLLPLTAPGKLCCAQPHTAKTVLHILLLLLEQQQAAAWHTGR